MSFRHIYTYCTLEMQKSTSHYINIDHLCIVQNLSHSANCISEHFVHFAIRPSTGWTSPTASSLDCVCQHGMASTYLEELCRPVSDIDDRRHLRSARRGLLDVPRVELSTYGRRAFSYASPSAWNAIPDYLKNSTLSLSVFRNQLKHFLFSSF